MRLIPNEGHQPQRPLTLRDAMNRLFDEAFWDPFGSFGTTSVRFPAQTLPKMDISETNKEMTVVADIPGYDPKDIEIDISDNTLSIKGKIQHETEQKDKKYYRHERTYGEFYREIPLPNYVDSTKVSCKAKNGILTITVPKKHQEDKKHLKIEME